MKPGNFLIKSFGEDIDLAAGVLASVALLPELDLGKRLVGEGAGHDKRRVASSAPKVEQTALSEDDNSVAFLEDEFIDLGLNVDTLGNLHEAIHINLIIEVTNITNNSIVLHLAHGLSHKDTLVTSGGDKDVSSGDNVLESAYGETLHAGLKGADGINLGYVNDATVGAHGSGTTFANITISTDHSLLTSHHNISGTHDTIWEGVLAAVKIVELGLCDRVVDVDGGKKKRAVFLHGVKTVNTGGGLLRNTVAAGGNLIPLVGLAGFKKTLDDGKDNLELGIVRRAGVGEGSIL